MMIGIEPMIIAYETIVLPLNYITSLVNDFFFKKINKLIIKIKTNRIILCVLLDK
jgi:hypothetical protein